MNSSSYFICKIKIDNWITVAAQNCWNILLSLVAGCSIGQTSPALLRIWANYKSTGRIVHLHHPLTIIIITVIIICLLLQLKTWGSEHVSKYKEHNNILPRLQYSNMLNTLNSKPCVMTCIISPDSCQDTVLWSNLPLLSMFRYLIKMTEND